MNIKIVIPALKKVFSKTIVLSVFVAVCSEINEFTGQNSLDY